MDRLTGLSLADLQAWEIEAHLLAKKGQLPHYIPKLSQANPEYFALQISCLDGRTYCLGDRGLTFPLMSAIKPFLLLYLLTYLGIDQVFDRVGKTPSDYPFNSLIQLQEDKGFPRNPMINSGAIALSDLLLGKTALSRCETFRLWLNQAGNCQLFQGETVLESVNSYPNARNQALARELAERGYIKNAQIALETYNHICCLSGTIQDLACLGILILNSPTAISQLVQEIMTTCGLYEASSEFARNVGLPTKSGVSGAVLSVMPNEGSIACYSPPLNEQGNPIVGLFFIEKIARLNR